MTDEPRDDETRPEIAAALAVPPLDDVTRRRLVRNALDAAAPATPDEDAAAAGEPEPRSWVPLVAAAVVILLVVAGIVALGRGGGDSSSDTAARRNLPTSRAESPEAANGAGTAADQAVAVVGLGDFGDLSAQQARTAAAAKVATADTTAAAPAPTDLVTRVEQAACAAPLREAGTSVVGVGSATVDGHDAAVVTVTQGADGARKTYLLVFSPCELTAL